MANEGGLSGATLGGAYLVGALLGEGSMGAVYEGTQVALGRPVAIKVLKARGGQSRAALERFGREARSAAALGHPNIVQVTDFRPDFDPPFLIMERLSGESLRQAIAREGRLEAGRVARIGVQLLDALAAAHRAGIVHRDVKPDNVFLTRLAGGTEMVKVLDFGVAKLLGDAPLTAHGALMGSPAYMSPEQGAGRDVDHRADLFSTGATLYHALTGHLPFAARSLGELLDWLATRPHTPATAFVPGADPRLVAILDRALCKDPAARFADAGEMRAALDSLSQVRSTGHAAPASSLPSALAASVAGDGRPSTEAPPPRAEGGAFAPEAHASTARAGLPTAVWVALGVAVLGGVGGLGALVVTGALAWHLGAAPPAPPGGHEGADHEGTAHADAGHEGADHDDAGSEDGTWRELVETRDVHCKAARSAPFANGKAGTFAALGERQARGLGSQLANMAEVCTARCASPDATYIVRIYGNGQVTEAKVARGNPACAERDDCVDEAVRKARIDAPPNGQEVVVEVQCRFDMPRTP